MCIILNNYDERLRAEIERLGVSSLAKQLNIARNTLYNWCEKGNVPLDKLMLLVSQGLDAQFVLTGQRSYSNLSSDEEVVLIGYRELDSQTKKRVKAFIFSESVPISSASDSVVSQPSHTGIGAQNNVKNINIHPAEGEKEKSVKISAKGKKSQAGFNITNNH